MRLATVRLEGAETAAVVLESGVVPMVAINDALGTGWPMDLLLLVTGDHLDDLRRWWDGISESALAELSDEAVPLSEVSYGPGEVDDLEVATVLNGEVKRSNVVSNMVFSPWSLVSFRSGDVAGCRISRFEPLSNPVRR